jgi:acyl-CoA synthetase (AMP-forming)/AMP-acid ligase II
VDGVSGRAYTYADLHGAIRRFATGLHDRGMREREVLAILSPNLPEYPIAFHGACTAGMAATTLNPLYTAEEINYQLRDSNARALVTVAPLLDKARAAARSSRAPRRWTRTPPTSARAGSAAVSSRATG